MTVSTVQFSAGPSGIRNVFFSRDIVADYGAVGDAQYAFSGLSITTGTKNLSATTALWSSADVGKGIHVQGAGSGSNVLTSTITTFTDSQNIVVNNNASTTLSASSSGLYVAWGTDDTSKFTTFGTSAAAQSLPAILNMPARKFFFQTSPLWAGGIRVLTVVGQSSVNTAIVGGPQMHLAGSGLSNNNLHNARCQTVSSGATQMVCLSSSLAARFAVNSYGLATCVDLQGIQAAFGFPNNNHFTNYAQITSADAGTGVVGLDRPLTHFYSSGYPSYFAGSGVGIDQGGPSNLYSMSSTFDTTVEYKNLLAVCSGQIDAIGKDITFRNCTFPGVDGPFPTMNMAWQSIDCDHSNCDCEVDKLIGQVTFTRSNIRKITCQSSPIDGLTVADSIVGTINGTPLNATITNSSVTTLGVAPNSYGVAATCTVSGGSFGGIGSAAYTEDGPGHTGVNFEFTMSSGVISFPSTYGAARWAVPGSWFMWVGTLENSRMTQVTNLTQDSSSTYVQTTSTGTFPTIPLSAGSSKMSLRPHPCPVWNCTSATGSAIAYSLSQPGAQGRPLFEYSKRTYTGDTNLVSSNVELLTNTPNAANLAKAWGQINTIKVNVTTPYTGPTATLNWTLAQFTTPSWTTLKADGSTFNLAITINAKVAGERVIQFSGNTGASSGDTLPTIPEATLWLPGAPQTAPILSTNVSSHGAGPIITVEFDANQGM